MPCMPVAFGSSFLEIPRTKKTEIKALLALCLGVLRSTKSSRSVTDENESVLRTAFNFFRAATILKVQTK